MKIASKAILDILKTVEGTGSYFSSGVKDSPLFGLQIKDCGVLGFPTRLNFLQQLYNKAQIAPFGQGNQTVVDDKIRKTRYFGAENIKFINKSSWEKNVLHPILKDVKENLGLQDREIKEDFYKLLIYKKGDFFKLHQDTERGNQMFGTLLIGLPIAHSGGRLQVNFQDQVESFDFSEHCSQFQLPYAAFYADCQHSIAPVESGFRLVLAYNLYQDDKKSSIKSPINEDKINALNGLLERTRSHIEKPLPIVLDHQYTPTNFSIEKLKSRDILIADIIKQAAQKSDYHHSLALIHYYQIGEPEYVYTGGFDGENYAMDTMHEVIDECIELDCFATEDAPGFDSIKLDFDNLVSDFNLSNNDPLFIDEEGYMGNYGPTLEYNYYYGSIVIWPKEIHQDILKRCSTSKKIAWLNCYARHERTLSNVDHENIEVLHKNIILSSNTKNLDYNIFLKLSYLIKDKNILNHLNESLLPTIFDKIPLQNWIPYFSDWGWKSLATLRDSVISLGKIGCATHYLNLINELLTSKSILVHEAEIEVDRIVSQGYIYSGENINANIKIYKKYCSALLHFASTHQEIDLWSEENWHSIKQVLGSHITAIFSSIFIANPGFLNSNLGKELSIKCHVQLLKEVEKKPSQPKDWKRFLPASNTELRIVEDFMQSSTESVFIYAKRKELRKELKEAILSHNLDLDMETIREGSPHKLRLTKNSNSFDKRLHEWKHKKRQLSLLKELMNKNNIKPNAPNNS